MYAQMTNMATCTVRLDQDRHNRLLLYRRTRDRGQLRRLWSTLTRKPRRLLDLSAVEANCVVHARSEGGLRTVPIQEICGSEGRSRDFDRDFRPLQGHTQERWLGIAAVRQQGKELPPVDLVQVDKVYFVQDGHHRISVARALGQREIDARVIVWQTERPLSVEGSTTRPSIAGAVRRATGKAGREGARLWARLAPSFQDLLQAITTLRPYRGGHGEKKAAVGPVSV